MQWYRTSLLVASVLVPCFATAQQQRDDGGNARLQAMVQQLTAEKTRLEADNGKLKTDLDKANAELKTLRDAQAGLERRLGQSEASLSQASTANTRSSAAIEQLRAREQEIVAEYRKLAEVLRTTELERNELRTMLASRESALHQCVTANQKMFETGIEVLDRYEEKGCFSAMRENEPFTQNRRVRLQNLVDEYRWALEDQKLPEQAVPAGATTEQPLPAGTTTDGT
jgi:septal ring factor EnvC (AmiA/AmiB activator)